MNKTFLLILFLLSSPSQASHFSGNVVTPPLTISVKDLSGKITEYPLPKEDDIWGELDGSSIHLARGGLFADCEGPYLGELASDFAITLQGENDLKKTVVFSPGTKNRKVEVRGECGNGAALIKEFYIASSFNPSIK